MCDSFSCPVACGYPQVVRENLPELKDAGAVMHSPLVNLTHTASLVRNLCREFNLPRGEVRSAVRAARHEQAHYLRGVARGELFAGFAPSEPEAGSDVGAMHTLAASADSTSATGTFGTFFSEPSPL